MLFCIAYQRIGFYRVGQEHDRRCGHGEKDQTRLRRRRVGKCVFRSAWRDRAGGFFYFSRDHIFHSLRFSLHDHSLRHRVAAVCLFPGGSGVAHIDAESRHRHFAHLYYCPSIGFGVQHDCRNAFCENLRARFDYRPAIVRGAYRRFHACFGVGQLACHVAPHFDQWICCGCPIGRFC